MKNLFLKYRHIIPVLIYMPIYLIWFCHLEKTVTSYRIIHTALDDKIPFLEVFIIPYLMWFGYVVACVAVAFFTDKDEYFKTLTFLITGMTIFLIVSTLWPNGHNLRPAVMPRDNFFTHLIAGLYRTDTPTNLWPSIHVYNSIGAHLCIVRCKWSSEKKWLKNTSLAICIAIIMSTMFIKQHSFFDVFMALIMSLVMAAIVYRETAFAFYKEHLAGKAEELHRSIIK
ncbi:MAG: serine/threonine protein phosphatase [Lachnospiraceae bacterium]|nr:serine/threonine protein phosphatase [Lachnospiraceae bacterium]